MTGILLCLHLYHAWFIVKWSCAQTALCASVSLVDFFFVLRLCFLAHVTFGLTLVGMSGAEQLVVGWLLNVISRFQTSRNRVFWFRNYTSTCTTPFPQKLIHVPRSETQSTNTCTGWLGLNQKINGTDHHLIFFSRNFYS